MARKTNIVIDQGSDFSITTTALYANGTAIDLTNYTVESKLRTSYTNSTSVSLTAAVSNATLGEISLDLDSANTGALEARRWVYDVEITSNTGIVTRVREGIATVTPEVTS